MVGKPPGRWSYLWWGVRVVFSCFFFFSKIVRVWELVKNFSYRFKTFTWWLHRPPMFSEIPGLAAAQIFEIREIQSLRSPILKSGFGFGLERCQLLRLGAGLTPRWCWPKSTRPAAADGRKRWSPGLQLTRASRPECRWRRGRLRPQRHSARSARGAPIVLCGAELQPAPGLCSPQRNTPAP